MGHYMGSAGIIFAEICLVLDISQQWNNITDGPFINESSKNHQYYNMLAQIRYPQNHYFITFEIGVFSYSEMSDVWLFRISNLR